MNVQAKLYFNKKTGNIRTMDALEAVMAGKDWQQLKFVRNDKGERVMRFEFDGATVDVSENK
jgi:hypothetical protein